MNECKNSNCVKDLISVILPVYNSELYLKEAMNSVVTQTYKYLEIIVVDDSDGNACEKIIQDFNDDRIKYFAGNKNGLVSALNLGVANATGEFIARMDSDDVAYSDRFLTQLNFIKSTGIDICGTWMSSLKYSKRLYKYPLYDNNIKFSMLFSCPLAHPTILGKAIIFKDNPYSTACKSSEDYELWTRLARKNVVFGNIGKPLMKFRVHNNQASVLSLNQLINDSIQISETYGSFYLDSDLFNEIEKYAFGQQKNYPVEQIVQLSELFLRIADSKRISPQEILYSIQSLFWKCCPVNLNAFIRYFKILQSARLSIFNRSAFYFLMQCFLRVDNSRPFYTKMKALIR